MSDDDPGPANPIRRRVVRDEKGREWVYYDVWIETMVRERKPDDEDDEPRGFV